MKTLLVFALVAAGLLPACAQFLPNCDNTKLQYCTTNFIQYLNYPSNTSVIWQDYQTFIDFSNNLISNPRNNPAGFITICNALEQLTGCLHGEHCLNPLSLLIRGSTPVQAYSISGLLDQFQFRCGAGLQTIIRGDLGCVQDVIEHHANDINNCLPVYQNNVAHDVQNACNHVRTYTFCVSLVFNQSHCGFAGSEDHWWACEGAYKFTQPQFPNCFLSCSLNEHNPGGGPQGGGQGGGQGGPGQLSYQEYASKHIKTDEYGNTWMKLPDIIVNEGGKVIQKENKWTKF